MLVGENWQRQGSIIRLRWICRVPSFSLIPINGLNDLNADTRTKAGLYYNRDRSREKMETDKVKIMGMEWCIFM